MPEIHDADGVLPPGSATARNDTATPEPVLERAAAAVADVVEDAAEAVAGAVEAVVDWLEGERGRPRLVVGANAIVAPLLRTAVPAATGRREYHPTVNAWPATWPQVPGFTSCVSIRPLPADLLAGDLDDQVRGFIAGAPAGSMLNCWHEAGNLPDYAGLPYVNPATITAVHKHMARLCAGSRVAYGPILMMPPAGMGPWTPAGCQVYGLDIYDEPQFHAGGVWGAPLDPARVVARLDGWKAEVARITGNPSPVLAVCETNSREQARRPQWFTVVGDWLAANGGVRMLTFWRDGGPLSGPWVPGDHATVGALAKLAGGGR